MLEMKEGNRLQEVPLSWKKEVDFILSERSNAGFMEEVGVHFTFLCYWLLYGD